MSLSSEQKAFIDSQPSAQELMRKLNLKRVPWTEIAEIMKYYSRKDERTKPVDKGLKW